MPEVGVCRLEKDGLGKLIFFVQWKVNVTFGFVFVVWLQASSASATGCAKLVRLLD